MTLFCLWILVMIIVTSYYLEFKIKWGAGEMAQCKSYLVWSLTTRVWSQEHICVWKEGSYYTRALTHFFTIHKNTNTQIKTAARSQRDGHRGSSGKTASLNAEWEEYWIWTFKTPDVLKWDFEHGLDVIVENLTHNIMTRYQMQVS